MICESRGLGSAFSHTAGSMYYNVADSGCFPVLTFQTAGQVSPSLPAPSHGEGLRLAFPISSTRFQSQFYDFAAALRSLQFFLFLL